MNTSVITLSDFVVFDDKSMTLSKKRRLNTIINSNLFLLEGSNKWTPKKWGLNPPRWGVPLKSNLQNLRQPTYTGSVRVKEIITSRRKRRGKGNT